MVGNGSSNKTERGTEEGKKGKVKFVQGKCGWQRGPEQNGGWEEGRKGKEKFVQDRYGWRRGPEHHGGREEKKKGKGGKDLFRIGVVGRKNYTG